MDRSWMQLKNRWCRTYIDGVRDFMRTASNYVGDHGRICSPCKNCNNVYVQQLSKVKQNYKVTRSKEHNYEVRGIATRSLAGL